MIARLRRLERVRALQFDRARAEHLRAQGLAAAAHAQARAQVEVIEQVLRTGFDAPALERELVAHEALHAIAVRHDAAAEAAAAINASAGRMWQRAEHLLLDARRARDALRRRLEQREHDELAARRKP